MFLRCYSSQRGAALVVALLIVAIVALLAAALGNNFLLLFKRVENPLYAGQARAYLLGAEGIARSSLLATEAKDYETLFDTWHNSWQFDTDYGTIQGQLSDLQGRLNVNSLVWPSPTGQIYSAHQQRFIRLLQLLDVEPTINLAAAEAITKAIITWQATPESTFDSMGDLYYSNTSPAMRMAHGPMMDVSELRLIQGIDETIYQALRPYVTVWPIDGDGAINVNTASERVLRTLGASNDLAPLSVAAVQTLLSEREAQQGFHSIKAFLDELPNVTLDDTALGVSSDYYLLHADADFLDRQFEMYSVLYRDKEHATVDVVARSQFGL